MQRSLPVALWEIVLCMVVVGGGVYALLERPWEHPLAPAPHSDQAQSQLPRLEFSSPPRPFVAASEAKPLNVADAAPDSVHRDAAVAPAAHWASLLPLAAVPGAGPIDIPTKEEFSLSVTLGSPGTEQKLTPGNSPSFFMVNQFSLISTTRPNNKILAELDEVKLIVDEKYSIQLKNVPEQGTARESNVRIEDGRHSLQVVRIRKDSKTGMVTEWTISDPFIISIGTPPFEVKTVDDDSLQNAKGPHPIKLTLNRSVKDLESSKSHFSFRTIDAEGAKKDGPAVSVTIDQGRIVTVTPKVAELPAGRYEIVVNRELTDEFGNKLGAEYVRELFRPVVTLASGPVAGLRGPSGKQVEFPDFTPPREFVNGFNPEDKVESRVVRLYYFRDAHRVAQIVNRTAQSYNKAGVERQRQLADAQRRQADQLELDRRKLEQEAVRAAEQSRIKEQELASAQQSLQTAIREAQTAQAKAQAEADRVQTATGSAPTEPNRFDTQAASLAGVANSIANKVARLEGEVQGFRNAEAVKNDLVTQIEGKERLAREEQFRVEVAAAKEDPDTYAAGDIKSIDPVAQTSVSVIGEGVLHLRGPIKGINVIRNMIHQIDSPAGQVRVSVHTVQINGERADRMEIVGDSIQKHIDQARFLTLRSSELLRKAVVQVAARKAEEGRALAPGFTQADRDQRYLLAFFGQDFVDELRSMDSEFLHTGNKLLSLHSMDSTSLASALMLMALAKNSTRLEILGEFEQLCRSELPTAEQRFIESGMACPPGKHTKNKQLPLCYLAQNASFESVRGFFNAEGTHDDTLTPLQREFIRLAQIFKSRFVTELEYRQRVTERAIIEERLGDYRAQLTKAASREQEASDASDKKYKELNDQSTKVNIAIETIVGKVTRLSSWDVLEQIRSVIENYGQVVDSLDSPGVMGRPPTAVLRLTSRDVTLTLNTPNVDASPIDQPEVHREYEAIINKLIDICTKIEGNYRLAALTDVGAGLSGISSLKMALNTSRPANKNVTLDNIKTVKRVADQLKEYLERLQVEEIRNAMRRAGEAAIQVLNDRDESYDAAFKKWIEFRNSVGNALSRMNQAQVTTVVAELDSADASYRELLRLAAESDQAFEDAQFARRPLDHKKFLDQLIGEVEDKYVELLDGTRAHTANIDNYIKRVITALDDDFNNQFYYPVFRAVRGASTYHDVQFGQTETTSVLANNRGFAKVSPQATMEFDLPERDIVITEAMNGAKAMIDEYGALVADPSFLALSKMKSGSGPVTPAPGSTSGNSTVRTVLPGLEGTTAEQYMAQNGPGRGQFGAAFENLIPDPAVYKFETGTGYEIRPVLQPDGQAVVFGFHYMYTTNIREPVRADEKHLGRVKRHFIDTDVQLSNFELREVSRYQVALKAARTSKGVPLLEDIPVAGVLFRPLPSQESSLQQNQILAQATIFPTLFDLMGLRWAPAVTDLDSLRLTSEEFVARGRKRHIQNRVFDHSSEQVDGFLRVPPSVRRPDLYRSQETIPDMHPNGYRGPGLDQRDSTLQEGYQPSKVYRDEPFTPAESPEGSPLHPRSRAPAPEGAEIQPYPLRRHIEPPTNPAPQRNGLNVEG